MTIFFETRPNVDPNGVPFAAAMAGIGYVAVNRSHTSGFLNRNLTTLKAIVKDMSNQWSKTGSNKYDGTADLITADDTLLASIMTGSQTDTYGNCAGLMWAFEVAQSVLYVTDSGDPGHNVYRTQVRSYFPKSLWFNSSGSKPSGNAYLVDHVQIPSCGGLRSMYYWGQNGVTWTGQSY